LFDKEFQHGNALIEQPLKNQYVSPALMVAQHQIPLLRVQILRIRALDIKRLQQVKNAVVVTDPTFCTLHRKACAVGMRAGRRDEPHQGG
jgi:hypothetical protein